MADPRAERIAALEAEIQRLRNLPENVCPWDVYDDPRANIPSNEPCPVCGMLGTMDAENKCVRGRRRDPQPSTNEGA
jgi:hypothetical protein